MSDEAFDLSDPLSQARAFLTAIEAEGYVVIPEKPTEAMIEAWADARDGESELFKDDYKAFARRDWHAFLSAAPKVTP